MDKRGSASDRALYFVFGAVDQDHYSAVKIWHAAAPASYIQDGRAMRPVTRAERLDRLLLILAVAYLLLRGIGLLALTTGHPRQWCSSNRGGECSVFVIGQIMLDRLTATPAQAWAALVAATERAVPKWGRVRPQGNRILGLARIFHTPRG